MWNIINNFEPIYLIGSFYAGVLSESLLSTGFDENMADYVAYILRQNIMFMWWFDFTEYTILVGLISYKINWTFQSCHFSISLEIQIAQLCGTCVSGRADLGPYEGQSDIDTATGGESRPNSEGGR